MGTTYQIIVSHLSKLQIIHKTVQCYNILSQQAVKCWHTQANQRIVNDQVGGYCFLHSVMHDLRTFRILLEVIPSHKYYKNTASFLKGYILIIT